MSNVERGAQPFNKEADRHLKRVRMLRRDSMSDISLDTLSRGVLGTSGSEVLLKKYTKLVEFLGNLVGEPVIQVSMSFEGERPGDSTGGIISGEPVIDLSGYSRIPGKDSAAMHIRVPVLHTARVFHTGYQAEYKRVSGTSFAHDGHMDIASIINHEYENYSKNPDKDFWDHDLIERGAVLVGRQAIYGSPLLSKGVSRTLLLIEEQAREAQDVTALA